MKQKRKGGKLGSIVYLMMTFSWFLCLNYACSSGQQKTNIQPIVKDYYETYQHRNDFQKFLNFYDEKIILEDIILGEKIEGINHFKDFFNWDDTNFKKVDSLTLIIEDQIVNKNKAVTKGYFTPFIWKDSTIKAMYFNTTLVFNPQGKIIKQIDWINYPNQLVDFDKRKNANQWIIHSKK